MIRKDIIVVKNGSIGNLISFLKIFLIFTIHFDIFFGQKMYFYILLNSSQFENTTKNSFVRNRFKLHMPFTYHERLRDTFIVKCSESGATMKPSWF